MKSLSRNQPGREGEDKVGRVGGGEGVAGADRGGVIGYSGPNIPNS